MARQNSDKHKKKMKAKRDAKKAKADRYAAQAKEGKSKKFRAAIKKAHVRSRKHPLTPCGNPGCKKCYPELLLKAA